MEFVIFPTYFLLMVAYALGFDRDEACLVVFGYEACPGGPPMTVFAHAD
jgi:hypothetical protein